MKNREKEQYLHTLSSYFTKKLINFSTLVSCVMYAILNIAFERASDAQKKLTQFKRDMQMGNVYHLDFDEKKSQGAKIAVLPGDPFRSETIASMISDQFKTGLKKLAWKREYCTYLTEVNRLVDEIRRYHPGE